MKLLCLIQGNLKRGTAPAVPSSGRDKNTAPLFCLPCIPPVMYLSLLKSIWKAGPYCTRRQNIYDATFSHRKSIITYFPQFLCKIIIFFCYFLLKCSFCIIDFILFQNSSRFSCNIAQSSLIAAKTSGSLMRKTDCRKPVPAIRQALQQAAHSITVKDHFLQMIHFYLIQGVGRNMLRSLLQVTDAGGIRIFLDHRIQRILCHH